MKTFLKTLGLVAMLAFTLFVGQACAQDDPGDGNNVSQSADNNISQDAINNAPQNGDNNVSFQTFYDQLASQGSWIQTDKYGYVFQPAEHDPNWRPYTYGHWVNTDDGMTWVSDESFGWATYHYGRWVNLDGYGWVWVPGYTWAPAWVSWRDSNDYVGWAPLPPDSDIGIDYFDNTFDGGIGFHIGDDCDLAYGIGPWCYNFCPVAFIGDFDCWRHFRDRRDNFALINHTRNVTNLNFHRDGVGRFGRVHADGPSVAALNARARTPIQQARLTAASSPAAAGLRGNTLAAFAPGIDPATAKTSRPGSVNGTWVNTNVNRGTDINRPLAVNSQIRPAGPTTEQIHAATLAQGNASPSAKVAGANTRPTRASNRPLTALQPNPNIGGMRSAATRGGGVRSSAAVGANGGPSPAITSSPMTRHTLAPSSAESRYTGESMMNHPTISSSGESAFTGAPATRHSLSPSSSGGSFYHPSRVFHTSSPVFHSGASAYHPQASFHSFAPAPQPHFSGGNFGRGASAAHFSGGGFSGGGRSGGGGGGHASSGGGHASGGGGHSGGRH